MNFSFLFLSQVCAIQIYEIIIIIIIIIEIDEGVLQLLFFLEKGVLQHR